MTGAVGQQRVPKNFLERYPMMLPPIIEQRKIVNRVMLLFTKMDQEKKLIQQLETQLDTLKQSILSKAFRGELGTNDPADEQAIELLKRNLQDQLI